MSRDQGFSLRHVMGGCCKLLLLWRYFSPYSFLLGSQMVLASYSLRIPCVWSYLSCIPGLKVLLFLSYQQLRVYQKHCLLSFLLVKTNFSWVLPKLSYPALTSRPVQFSYFSIRLDLELGTYLMGILSLYQIYPCCPEKGFYLGTRDHIPQDLAHV